MVGYEVHPDFGGPPALARFRQRLQRLGLRLLLDFVPNHTAPDHRWVREHPEFYVPGSEADLAQQPQNYIRMETPAGSRILAYGRDPYFDGWPDTLQLNYRHSGFRAAQVDELMRVAQQCDAVRCDMAMLLEPEVFIRTWGDRSRPTDGSSPVDDPWWPEAIRCVRTDLPDFKFMAEVYWDMEWQLQQRGFDYTYDKRLYDRLVARDAREVNGHLHADADFQRRSARFVENHDEPRAAATFPLGQHQAAAVITYLVPGLRFFHQGQLEGWRIKTPLHLARWPQESDDPELQAFYARLLGCVVRPEVTDGRWELLSPHIAWEGNPTWEDFVAFAWEGAAGQRLLTIVNYGPTQGQCYLALPSGWGGQDLRFGDQMGSANYDREAAELARQGLYLDLPAWGYNVFEVTKIPS